MRCISARKDGNYLHIRVSFLRIPFWNRRFAFEDILSIEPTMKIVSTGQTTGPSFDFSTKMKIQFRDNSHIKVPKSFRNYKQCYDFIEKLKKI